MIDLADWNYIVGEDNINQDFIIIDKTTNKGAILPNVNSADITILNSDLSAVSPPIQNKGMNIITNDPMRVQYVIQVGANDMPQTPGMFLAIIRLRDTTLGVIIKTFEIDLRVFIGG